MKADKPTRPTELNEDPDLVVPVRPYFEKHAHAKRAKLILGLRMPMEGLARDGFPVASVATGASRLQIHSRLVPQLFDETVKTSSQESHLWPSGP